MSAVWGVWHLTITPGGAPLAIVIPLVLVSHCEVGVPLTFALVGLCLHVEKYRTGRRVQFVDMQLAKRKRQWPEWTLPSNRGAVTVEDVIRSRPGAERDEAIDIWRASVWQAFSSHRDAIVTLLEEYGLEG